MSHKSSNDLQDLQYFGEYGGVNPSISDSSTYTFISAKTMFDTFEGNAEGCYLYSRHSTPSNLYLGEALAAMEGTETANVAATGMGAITPVLLQLCKQGDHVVSSRTIYGGTYAFLKNFKFGNKRVGKDSKIFFIAEIGINHEGNLDNCKRMILEAYKSGADAVKLQTIDPDENYAKNTKFYKIFKKAFFNEEQTIKLFKYAKNVGIEFFSTIGDINTLHWFSKLNPPGYKISSGLFNHYPLIKNICKTRKPIFLSTGLATIQEIDGVFKYLKLNKVKKIALLHCCSLYPTPDSLVNLSTIKFFIDRYPSIPIGYSDHSLNDKSIIYSIVLGARIIEKHFTLDKKKLSFDHKISIEPKELRHLVAEIKNVEKMLGVYKKNLGIKEKKNRIKYFKRFRKYKKVYFN